MARRSGDSVLRISGLLGLLGAIALPAANAAGIIVVERHDWISDTISDLAAGPHDWIQDLGLYLFALGLAALGLGLWRLQLDAWRARAGAALLWVVAADVVLMAFWEDYRNPDPGFTIHPYAVYLFGIALGLVFALLARGLGQIGRGWAWASLALFIAWAILAPIYFFVPATIEGLYERGLGLLVVGWMLAVSVLLLEEGRARR